MGTLLIVDQLPHDCTDRELADLFKPFGDVTSARLVRDHLHNFLGFAFVEMKTSEEARCAASKLNGTGYRGLELVVSLVNPQNRASG
jgi:RNA recognition motif-containing protein